MVEYGKKLGNFQRFKGATAEDLEAMIRDFDGRFGIKVDMGDNQNGGPTLGNVIEVLKKYGGYASGYIIYSPRDDARITVDTVVIPEKAIFELDNVVNPDDVWREGGMVGMWWD